MHKSDAWRARTNLRVILISHCTDENHNYVKHACMHLFLYAHACTHSYMHMHAHMHPFLHAHACTHSYMHIHAHACIHCYMHMHASILTCTCMHTFLHAHPCTHASILTCTCMHPFLPAHACTHAHHPHACKIQSKRVQPPNARNLLGNLMSLSLCLILLLWFSCKIFSLIFLRGISELQVALKRENGGFLWFWIRLLLVSTP
jgi:hypothetical protein